MTFSAPRRFVLLASFVCLGIACSPKTPAPQAKTADAEPRTFGAVTEASADGISWREEKIDFPPQWAPELPKGEDELRFAPGMFKREDEGYWSYAFVLRLDEKFEGEAALASLLNGLYRGLISSVARGRKIDFEGEAATVDLSFAWERHFRGHVDLVDAFVTGERIRVHLEVETVARTEGGTAVRVAASPQDANHGMWPLVRGRLATIPSE